MRLSLAAFALVLVAFVTQSQPRDPADVIAVVLGHEITVEDWRTDRHIFVPEGEERELISTPWWLMDVPHSRRFRLRLWPGPAHRPWNKRSRSLALPGDVCSMQVPIDD